MRKPLAASVRLALIASTCLVSSALNAQEKLERSDEKSDKVIVVTGELSTFGATKSEIPILETARSVSVITEDKWLERGALTLDDTLNYTAGVVGDTFGFSTRGDFPRVRGLAVPEYLDNIQVLFGFYNNARSDIYTLEQVEVLKGPASVLYGQGSPGGILNTVSKRAGPDAIGSEILVDYGTFDRTQVSADIGVDLSGDGTLTGRLVTLYRDAGTQVDFVNDDAFVIAPSLTYDNGRTVLTLLANYTERDSDTAHQFLPLAATGCVNGEVTVSEPNICSGNIARELDPSIYVGDPAFNRYNTESFSLTGFVEHSFTDALAFEATARYRDNSADYRQTWIAFLGAGVPRIGADGTAFTRSWYDAPASSDQFAIDGRLRARFETGSIRHEVLAGVNYQTVDTLLEAAFLNRPTTFNVFAPVYDGSEIPTGTAFDAARGRSVNELDSIGYYINNQMEWGAFVLNAGVRLDELDTGNGTTTQKDDATSLSFGALYRTDIGLNPYVSYAESFQAVIGNDQVTNQPLLPQRGKQLEIGVKFQPRGTRTYVTAAWFDIEQSNLPNPAGLPNAPSQQEGVAKIDGFEVEAQTALGDFYLDAAFSVINTADPNGVVFPSVPEVQGSAWATWRPSQGVLAGLVLGGGVRVAGSNESNGTARLAANGFAPTPVLIETDGYTVFDTLIGYSFDRYSITLNARNLFNSQFYGTCLARGDCFPGEVRTIQARVGVRF